MASSTDGRTVYVGEAGRNLLRVFARDPLSGEFTPREVVPLGRSPGNVTIDEQERVWIAVLPET